MKDALEKILSYLAVYIPDLVRLVSGPKAFVAKRNKETERNLAKAFTFLVLSLAIFFVLQWGFVIPGKENSTDALVHGIMYVFFVLVFSAILWLSWRIVGGKADYQRFAITTAYYVGICLVGIGIAVLCFMSVLRVFFPASTEWFNGVVAAKNVWPIETPTPEILKGIVAASLAFLVVVAATFVWGLVAWGAYREMNQLPRSRSCAALFLTVLFSCPLVGALFIVLLKIP